MSCGPIKHRLTRAAPFLLAGDESDKGTLPLACTTSYLPNTWDAGRLDDELSACTQACEPMRVLRSNHGCFISIIGGK